MTTKKLYFAAIIFLLILSGCNGGGGGGGSTPKYHYGTEGILFNFMKNSPPSEAFQGDRIPFAVEIKNQGTYSTSPNLWLSGHDENIIKIRWRGARPSPNRLDAKDENNPLGGYSVLESYANVNLPNKVDDYSTNMKLTACYPYVTNANAQVCIDPDPTSNQDDACTAKDISLSGGQGGPVAITHIDEGSSKDTIRFAVTVENVGTGTIIDKSKIGTCTNLRLNDIDIVSISADPLSGRRVTCKPNPIRLKDGNGMVYCSAPMGNLGPNAFTGFLIINLNYGYKQTISKSISVRRI
ncbi:MAG: hypothetical protein MAG795_01063 [Candidatus Woesearchaeota archaeon]|nr:hypothetical protein [Candidatus Woesearchaeota archaeon]